MISICIITKNEAENLNQCLDRLHGYDYELVVVDTGSTDNTKQIALRYTDKIYDFPWCNDFSAARNFAISKASHEFILMLDSDEFTTKIEKEELEELIHKHSRDVGRIHCCNRFIRGGQQFTTDELVSRLFSKQHYRYEGNVHEQIVSVDGEPYQTYTVPVYMDHTGYDGTLETRKRKSKRNIKLLEQALRIEEDSYLLYQLGKSYYFGEDYRNAVYYFSKALNYDLDTRLEYVIDMVEMYGYALLECGRNSDALLFENIYDEFAGSADFVFLMGFIYMQNMMFDQAEKEFCKAPSCAMNRVIGVNSFLAYYNAGVIRECLGDKRKAVEYYELCGEYEPAKTGIQRCGNSD